MKDVKREANKLYGRWYKVSGGEKPYATEAEFAQELRNVAECGLKEAKRTARVTFLWFEINNAETLEELKSVLLDQLDNGFFR